jgi:hypothetical protein
LSQPFFCDVKNIIRGVHVLNNKAFLYAKYWDIFVWLGRVTGFKIVLKLYQLRRALGRNINSKSALSTLLIYLFPVLIL